MFIARVLLLMGAATAASAQTSPVYEPIWATGQSIFRLHDGKPETVYRHPSVVTAVGAGAGGRIAFLADKAIWLLDRGATKPVKVGRAPRLTCGGRPVTTVGLEFDGMGVAVLGQYCEESPSSDASVALPAALATAPPAPGASLELDTARVSGTPGTGVISTTPVKIECGTFPRIAVARGGAVVLLVDVSGLVGCEDGENGCGIEFGGLAWLAGGHLVAAVGGGCGPGGTDYSVLPAGQAKVMSCTDSSFSMAPDAKAAICGEVFLGPHGDVVPIGANAIWSER